MSYTYHYKIHPQKRVGTYERNQLIKQLYKPGRGQYLADRFHISRQRVHQIVFNDKGVNNVET